MSCIYLRTLIVAGTDIRQAVGESIELSKTIGCNIEFSFNDISVFINPKSNIEEKVKQYMNDLEYYHTSH